MSDIVRDYSFGGWLRHRRLEIGMTLRISAKHCRMDAGNYSKLERSELDPPRNAKKIQQMCNRLGMIEMVPLLLSLAFQHHLSILRNEFKL